MTTRTKRLTMTIPEAAEKLGIGRNQGYEAARSGQIPTIKIGKRLLVPETALENKLANAGGSNRDKVA
jgi:excisionase family DNA binding protein